MTDERPSISVSNTSIFKLTEYLVNQLAIASGFTFVNSSVYLTEKYSKSEILIISSQRSRFNLIGNLFLLNKRIFDCFIRIISPGVYLNLEDLITRYENLNKLVISTKMDIAEIRFSQLEFSNYKGILILIEEYENKHISFSNITIERSIFKVENNTMPFLNLKGFANLFLNKVIFLVSKSQNSSIIFSENPESYIFESPISLTMMKINIYILKLKSPEKERFVYSPSPYPALASIKSFSHIDFKQVFIFLHKINMKALMIFEGGKNMLIEKCSFIGNYLNQISHFLLLKIAINFNLKIISSKFIKNRVAYGAIMSIELVHQQLEKNYPKISISVQNNQLNDNEANMGGFVYFNSSYENLNDKNVIYYKEVLLGLSNSSNNSITKASSSIGSFVFWEGDVPNPIRDEDFGVHAPDSSQYQIYNAFSSIHKVSVSPLEFLKYDSAYSIQITEKLYQNKKEEEDFYFCIGMFDRNHNLFFSWSEAQLKASLGENQTLIKSFTFMKDQIRIHFRFHKGLYCAYKFEILKNYFYLMGLKFNITFDPYDALKDSDTTFKYLSKSENNPLNILFEIDECKKGEFFEDSTQACTPCERNSFSASRTLVSQPDCEICRETDNFNCYGANLKSPKANYWRLNFDSNRFLRCPSPRCLGDVYFEQNFTQRQCFDCYLPGSKNKELYLSYHKETTAVGVCASGHQGILCTGCNKGFGFEIGYKCGDCSSNIYYLQQFLVLGIKLCLFLFMNYNSIKNKFSTKDLNSPEYVSSFKKVFLINILLAHFNYLSYLNSIKFDFGNIFEETTGIAVNLSPSEDFEGFSFECLLVDLGLTYPPYIFMKTLISSIFLILILFAMIGLSIVRLSSQRESILEKIKSVLRGVILIFITDNIILIMNTLVSSLICVDVGGEEAKQDHRLLQQPNVPCYDSTYNYFSFYFALPLTIITGGIVPLYILIYLLGFRWRKIQMNHEFLRDFGRFYCSFKKNFNYFVVVQLISKISLVILKQLFLALIIINKELTGVLIYLLFTIVIYGILSAAKPYKKKNYGGIERCELFSLSTNISNGLIAFFWLSTQEAKRDSTLLIVLIFYFILSNGLFLMRWVMTYFSFKSLIQFLGAKKRLSEFVESKMVYPILQIFKKSKKSLFYFEKNLKGEDYVSVSKKDLENMNLINKLLIGRVKSLERKLAFIDHENQIKKDSLLKKFPQNNRDAGSTQDKIPSNFDENSSPINRNSAAISAIIIEPKILEEISLKSQPDSPFEQNIIFFKQAELESRKSRSSILMKNNKMQDKTTGKGSIPEIVMRSREIYAKSFYDHLLVLKYSFLTSEFKDLATHLRKMKSLDQDWSVKSLCDEQEGIWVLALKKNSKWIQEPFEKFVDLETKYHVPLLESKGRIKITVSLSDFISIESLTLLEPDTLDAEILDEIIDFKLTVPFSEILRVVKAPEKSKVLNLSVQFRLFIIDKKQKEAIVKLNESGNVLYSSELNKNQMKYLLRRLEKNFSI